MDVVIAAIPQLFTAQVSEEERQLALFIDVSLKTIHPKLYLLNLNLTFTCMTNIIIYITPKEPKNPREQNDKHFQCKY